MSDDSKLKYETKSVRNMQSLLSSKQRMAKFLRIFLRRLIYMNIQLLKYHELLYLCCTMLIYKISCLTHAVIGQLQCLYQAVQTWLWRHSIFPKKNRKWPSCVYITWCKHSREFSWIWRYFCKPSSGAWVHINFEILPNSPSCLHQVI